MKNDNLLPGMKIFRAAYLLRLKCPKTKAKRRKKKQAKANVRQIEILTINCFDNKKFFSWGCNKTEKISINYTEG